MGERNERGAGRKRVFTEAQIAEISKLHFPEAFDG